MTKIVVLGGGFGGVSSALTLLNKKLNYKIEITLIDQNNYHLFTPSLYEVATAEETQSNIAIPFKEIFKDRIKIIKAKIGTIDTNTQTITLADETKIQYDYLIIALGSQPSYFDIPGLEKYSLPLKNLKDAVKIKNSIDSIYRKKAAAGEKTRIIIGGGGFSGTELAAEIAKYRNYLSKIHNLPPGYIDIKIIQGSERLLKELDLKVSDTAEKRLLHQRIDLCVGAHIKNITNEIIETDDGKKYDYDILLWTGGIEGNSLAKKSDLPTNKRGQIPVTQTLQIANLDNVFAIGDIACFVDTKTNIQIPQVVQVAEDQGKIAAENIGRLINKIPLTEYQYKHFGYVVPLCGRYAAAELNWGIKVYGFFGWLIQQIVFLRYLLGILSISKAFKKWNKFEKDLN